MSRLSIDCVAIRCATETEANTLMELLHECTQVKWRSGHLPKNTYNGWSSYRERTVFTIRKNTMSRGDGTYPKAHCIPILSLDEFMCRHGFHGDTDDSEVDLSDVI